MALLWIEGFENYDTGAGLDDTLLSKGYAAASSGISSTTGRSSSGLSATLGSTTQITPPILASSSTWVVGTAFKLNSASLVPGYLIRIRDASTGGGDTLGLVPDAKDQIYVDIDISSFKLKVYRGAAVGTLLGTGTTTIKLNTWYYLEVKTTIANSGSFEVRLNGVTEIPATSADTQNSSNAFANMITFGRGFTAATNLHYDDMYITNGTTFLGDILVEGKLPDGVTNVSTGNFTPLSGTKASNIDDTTPDDDTTYISSNVTGAKETFSVPALTSITSVVGVAVDSFHRKATPGGSRTIGNVIGSGGTDYNLNSETCSDSYSYLTSIQETDPDTGLPWTVSGVNNALWGFRIVS